MSKTAIVLAGGGSRGAYQMGVWQALRELGIEYQLVTGTSVGALNAAMMVQGDYKKALAVWQNLSSRDIVGDMLLDKGDLSDHQLTGLFAREALEKGGADVSALEQFVYSLVDEERFYKSNIDFALVTVEYPSMKPLELQKKDIPKGMLGEYLLASAACFPAFQVKEIEGRKYIDGGYHDNMPVNLALKMGADWVIAVDLESVGVSRKVKTENQKLTVIRSQWPLGSFLKFEKELAKRNIKLGYLDTLKCFGKLDGQLYTFYKDSAFFYTPKLRVSTEQLVEQMKQREPRLIPMMQNVVMRRMLREFRRRSAGSRTLAFTISRQMILAAEYLGEIFELDPTRPYEFGEFIHLLLAAAKIYREKPLAQELFLSGRFTDLQKVGEELQKLDRAFLVLLIRERIERLVQGGGNLGELMFMTAFWREFAAAIFLHIIQQMNPDQFYK